MATNISQAAFSALHCLKVGQKPLLACASYGSRTDDEEGTFLVVTREGSISAFSSSCSCLLHHFATLHPTVISIHHSGHGDHIVTLESDVDGDDTFISVYHDWRGSNFKGRGSVRAFTLPLASPDASIAVCPETGHVAVVDWSAAIVSFWHCTAGPFEHIAEMQLHIARRSPRVGARLRRAARGCAHKVALYSDLLAVGSGSEAKLFHVPLHRGGAAVEAGAESGVRAARHAAAAAPAAASVRCTFSAIDGQPLLLPPSLVAPLGGVPARDRGGGSSAPGGAAPAEATVADIALEAASRQPLLHIYEPRLNAASGYTVGRGGTRLLLQRTFAAHRVVHSITLVPAPECTGGAIMQLLLCTHRTGFLYALGVTRSRASSASAASRREEKKRRLSVEESRSHAWREMYGRIESVDPPQRIARYDFRAQLVDAAMAPRSDAPLLLYALTHRAIEVWTRGGALLCVYPLDATTPRPAFSITALSRYVVLLPLSAGEDLPPLLDAARRDRASTVEALRARLPRGSMELRGPDDDAEASPSSYALRQRTPLQDVNGGADSIQIFHCASTVALCHRILALVGARSSEGEGDESGSESGGITTKRTRDNEARAILEEMFRALGAWERVGKDERHFELAQRELMSVTRRAAATETSDAIVQRLCRQLQAANRTAMQARVAGSIARLILADTTEEGGDHAFRAAFYLSASDVQPDEALEMLRSHPWALTAYLQVVLLPATEELALPVAGVQVNPNVRKQSVHSATFMEVALQHLRSSAPPSVLADIAIGMSVDGDANAASFALQMLDEIEKDASEKEGGGQGGGAGGGERADDKSRRSSFSTVPAGAFGPRAQLARAVLLLRQTVVAGGRSDGMSAAARKVLAKVSPSSLADICVATPRLLLEGVVLIQNESESSSQTDIVSYPPFVDLLWDYSPEALARALVCIVKQPIGALDALGLPELSAKEALALLHTVAAKAKSAAASAGDAAVEAEVEAETETAALHPVIVLFMESVVDESRSSAESVALVLAQHYMSSLRAAAVRTAAGGGQQRLSASAWKPPRWYLDATRNSQTMAGAASGSASVRCPAWVTQLDAVVQSTDADLPTSAAAATVREDTSLAKLALLIVSDRLHAEGRVADAVLTASDDFESSAVLRVLCLAQLGRFDDALVSLLGILSEHVVVAASDDATTRVAALEDVFLAFVNDFCTTLAHWRAVCAALFVAILEKEKEAKVSEQQAKAKASFCRTLYTLVLGSLVATLSFASFSSLLPENVRSCFFFPFLPLPIVLTPLYLSLLLYSPLTGKHRVLPSFLGAKCCARCVRALSTRAPREQRS